VYFLKGAIALERKLCVLERKPEVARFRICVPERKPRKEEREKGEKE